MCHTYVGSAEYGVEGYAPHAMTNEVRLTTRGCTVTASRTLSYVPRFSRQPLFDRRWRESARKVYSSIFERYGIGYTLYQPRGIFWTKLLDLHVY